ncbi:MAG: YeeE/YedE thiosulfate transporter family protein [Bacillota bacterium]
MKLSIKLRGASFYPFTERLLVFITPSKMGIAAIVLLLVWAVFQGAWFNLLVWLLGALLGFSLHRARFCFAAAFRDVVLFRDISLTKALIIIFFVSTIGFAFIQYMAYSDGLPVPGNIYPIGFHTFIGAFVFGIGMVLAGGCVCGMLARLGEGYVLALFILLGIMAGSLVGAYNAGWWEVTIGSIKPIFFPEYFGWVGGITVQFLALGLLYILCARIERKRM